MQRLAYYLLLLFNLLCSSLFAYEYEIALCGIFQNEACYLKEWIEFHKLVGVKHFYLFNHLSTDNYKKVLAPYIKSGEVELIEWQHHVKSLEEWNHVQLQAYRHAIHLAEGVVKWLIVVDTDEFVFPVEQTTLKEFLSDYDQPHIGAIGVNWQMYGTSHVPKLEKGDLMIEKMILKAPTYYPPNVHIKSIIRPERVHHFADPHHCVLLPNYLQVDSNKKVFSGPFNYGVIVDKIRINHYWTRDEYFLHQRKAARRKKWRDNTIIEAAKGLNQVEDTSIHKYLKSLKKAMQRSKKKK